MGHLLTFLAGFLAFQMQLVAAKWLLPYLGGSAAVWLGSLLFFQSSLLLAYLFVDRMVRRPSRYFRVLLMASGPLLFFALFFPRDWALGLLSVQWPLFSLLVILLVVAGPLFVLLTALSPLFQSWSQESNPYRYYFSSNIGAALGLLSYPFIVEPALSLSQQWLVVKVLAAVCTMAFLWWASRLPKKNFTAAEVVPITGMPSSTVESGEASKDEGFRVKSFALVLFLTATSCALFQSYSLRITEDLPVSPILWVFPLCLYLIAFALPFHPQGLNMISRAPWLLLFAFCVWAARGEHSFFGWSADLSALIFSLGAVFTGCLCAHAEIARRKPEPRHLTTFYLAINIGGVIGGIFVNIVAPNFFITPLELPVSIVNIFLLTFLAAMGSGVFQVLKEPGGWAPYISLRGWDGADRFLALLTCVGAGVFLLSSWEKEKASEAPIYQTRNFYGIVKVTEDFEERLLYHGSTLHGTQSLRVPEFPTTYYGPKSGVDLGITALRSIRQQGQLKIAVVGLGTGSMVTYGQPGDQIDFYEINPAMEHVAKEHFSFLKDSQAEVNVYLGDARVVMESFLDAKEDPKESFYDLIFVDAFSGNSIPTHLLSAEAFVSYRRLLRDDGIVALHISNRYAELEGVVRASSEFAGFDNSVSNDCCYLVPPSLNTFIYSSHWVLNFNGEDIMVALEKAADASIESNPFVVGGGFLEGEDTLIDQDSVMTQLRSSSDKSILWTDDYSPLSEVLMERFIAR